MKPTENEKTGTLDAARALFEQMTGEARRRARVEKQGAGKRSTLVKILRALALTASLAAAVALVYGFYNFPDAPLRQTNGAYTGKQGQPRTREDFEGFKIWEKTLWISGGAAFVFCFAFSIADLREKRRRKSQLTGQPD